jgi:hypothetical protein
VSVFWKRFWDKVKWTPTCWLWTGGRFNHGGYGRISQGNRGKQVHRLAYARLLGPIPEGLLVCHHCDEPRCVNPRHLFLGTQGDNARDRMRKDRGARGSWHGRAKLTDAQVAAIRASYTQGNGVVLARAFGIAHSTLYRIVSGKRYRLSEPSAGATSIKVATCG